jgi:hypothetical protein
MQMVEMIELFIVTFQCPLAIQLQYGAAGTTNRIWMDVHGSRSDKLLLALVSIAIIGSW